MAEVVTRVIEHERSRVLSISSLRLIRDLLDVSEAMGR
jgi:hypothetical protein